MSDFKHLMIGLDRPKLRPVDRAHQVKMVAPELGLGATLNEMHAFCAERNQGLISVRQKRGPDYLKFYFWAFADHETARDFAARFGGEMLSRPSE